MKIKNNLLASVLILTSTPPSIQQSQAAVEHCCFLISQRLLEGPEVISIAFPSRVFIWLDVFADIFNRSALCQNVNYSWLRGKSAIPILHQASNSWSCWLFGCSRCSSRCSERTRSTCKCGRGVVEGILSIFHVYRRRVPFVQLFLVVSPTVIH